MNLLHISSANHNKDDDDDKDDGGNVGINFGASEICILLPCPALSNTIPIEMYNNSNHNNNDVELDDNIGDNVGIYSEASAWKFARLWYSTLMLNPSESIELLLYLLYLRKLRVATRVIYLQPLKNEKRDLLRTYL